MKRILRNSKHTGIRERTVRYIIKRLVLLEAQKEIKYPALEKFLAGMRKAKHTVRCMGLGPNLKS